MNLSILGRMVMLVAATLVAALAAMLFVTFRGPPPHSRPLPLEEVVALARGYRSGAPDWTIERMRWSGKPEVPEDLRPMPVDPATLAAQIGVPDRPVLLFTSRGPGGPLGPFAPVRRERVEMRKAFLLAWNVDGRWQGLVGRQSPSWRWYILTFTIMAGIFALLLFPAYLAARRITRPLHRLADGVRASRRDRHVPLPVEGPPEVKQLGNAFNAMQRQLIAHVEERTTMLAAIAHDLRTPLTRMSFRLEKLPDAERLRAQADVDEMRVMIAKALDFVRGNVEPLATFRIDLAALVEAVASDYAEQGKDVALGEIESATILGDPNALRRCIDNVVDNALRYGGSARLSLGTEDGFATVVVEDEGPGVAAEQLERLCDPFFRGEQSRNQETGGVGLGLSNVRKIMEGHDGRVAFANRESGGLRVTLVFPSR